MANLHEIVISPGDADYFQFDEVLAQLTEAETHQLINFAKSKPITLSRARELAMWATTSNTDKERADTFVYLLKLLKENRWHGDFLNTSQYFH